MSERDQAEKTSSYSSKATGIELLPAGWTPPFFVLDSGWTARTLARSTGLPDEGDLGAVAQKLKNLGGADFGVIVRSSAVKEFLRDRGRFDSVRCPPEASEIMSSGRSIWMQATAYLGASAEIALIVQVFKQPVLAGHLSNERRVARSRTR